jgi:hypothetical protein
MLPLAFNSHLDNNNNVGLHTFVKMKFKFKNYIKTQGGKKFISKNAR